MISKDYKPSNKVVIVSILFIVLLLCYAIWINYNTYQAFSGDIRYIPGTTKKIYLKASGRGIEYKYFVDEVEYEGAATYAYNSEVPGGKYWVKYSVEYPEISKIYQNMPVDARIDTIPPNGFKGRYNYEQFLQWKEWAAQQKRKK